MIFSVSWLDGENWGIEIQQEQESKSYVDPY